MRKFMITTPVYYVNAPLHLGHAYCSLACDVMARWRGLEGDDVFFLTGTDEHGGNIEKVAQENATTPQEWADRMAAADRDFFRTMGVKYGDFIRTTEERHRRATEKFWRKVAEGKAPDGKSNIYKGEYEGWYCRACEAYFTEGELAGGKCPIHQVPAEKLKEETYFFHLSGWQERIREVYGKSQEGNEKEPSKWFVVPDVRFNEMMGLIREGLRDISISRSKVKWGFPVPGDPAHVIYVWFDALVNYLTAIGYADDSARFSRYWPADMHVIGKEILRFHALLWPALLLAAGLPLPGKITAHGWWTVDGEKMSKSRGNVIDPCDYAKEFSLDAVRYFLMREIPFGGDGDFSRKRFIERYNADLANDFGNLAHRTMSMVFRYLDGKARIPAGDSPWEKFIDSEEGWPDKKDRYKELHDAIKEWANSRGLSFTQAAFECFVDRPLNIPQPQDCLNDMWRVIKHGHKYLDTQAPWNKGRAEQEEILGQVLLLLEAASWPLQVFMPEKAGRLREQLGLPADKRVPLPEVLSLVKGDPLFPRIETKKN